MDQNSLTQALTSKHFGRSLVFLEQVDSTNSEAIRRISSGGLPSGSIVIAARQSAGRGTGANAWVSDKPEGLWFSLVLDAPLQFNPIQFLPAIALADMVRRKFGVPAHVKWPNDVLVGTKKLSGTLIESRTRPDGIMAYVIGIGLNVNQLTFHDSIAHKAISLLQATTKTILPLEDVFDDLLVSLENWYNNASDPIEAWSKLTRMNGRVLSIATANGERVALCEGVSRAGSLQLRDKLGHREELISYTATDISASYAAVDTSAWCSLARAGARECHPSLQPGPSATYHTRSDEEDLERQKTNIPYLTDLFIARDIVYREEVRHICDSTPSIRQLISLGAGYDEWYARELGNRLAVFEIDTQAVIAKKQILAKHPYPGHLVISDVLEFHSLHERLIAHGYDPALPTVLIMQGLLNYIPEDKMEELFLALSALVASDSYMAFDFQIGDPPSERVLASMRAAGMRTDFHPLSTWTARLEQFDFEAIKVLNLGYVDPIQSFGQWRDQIRSTVFVLRTRRAASCVRPTPRPSRPAGIESQ